MPKQFFAAKENLKEGRVIEVVILAADNRQDAYEELCNLNAGLREVNPDFRFSEVSLIIGWIGK